MNLIQLRYFQAVCVYQTVSAAAEYLHISQPALSSAIKELENEFGVTLFHRQHSGMALTGEGETLLEMSRKLLSGAEEIESVMHDLGKANKKLRLGVPPMIGFLLMPYIFGGFAVDCPDVQLEITEGGRQELLKKLSDDLLDMIFLPHNRPLDRKFAMHKVAQLEIVCCASKENPISACSSVQPSDLAGIPLILFKDSFFQTEEIKKWFTLAGVKPNILLQTNQFSTMQTMIANNVAAGFLFKELVKADSGLVSIPVSDPMYVDVSLAWKKDAYFLDAMGRLKKYFQHGVSKPY